MKVFISWSGQRSQAVAETLRNWLPLVLQPIRPWLSGYDIQAGSRWASEMALQLEEAAFGILCLTPENLEAPWMLFEAGALSKHLDGSRVCPYLFGFEPRELRGPLMQFQAARADEQGTKQLLLSINRALGENRLPDHVLDESFSMWWPRLYGKLTSIESTVQTPVLDSATESAQEEVSGSIKSDRELLEQLVRSLLSQPNESNPPTSTQTPVDSNIYVFVVHGHNQGQKETVARLIEKLGAKPIILHEQPNQGQTVIEKLEAYSNVGYAVVIMTGDDIGGSLNSTFDGQQRRARQNVVLELGYFLAKLGRNRVCVLYEDEIEIPSDYAGVLYIRMDKEGMWRFLLAKELKVAGINVDLNRAF